VTSVNFLFCENVYVSLLFGNFFKFKQLCVI
jgi:hypothetical protein